MSKLLEQINSVERKTEKLGNLLSLIIDKRGITPKKLGSDWVLSGIPVISAKNIKHHSIVNRDQIRFIDNAIYQKWMPNPIKPKDIILTSEAPMGELYFIKNDEIFCLGQRLFGLRANTKKLYPDYLFQFLQSKQGQHELKRRISGTAAEGIRQAELVNIQIQLPNLSTQKKIAEILSAYDAKIENNNKIIKNLEATAQTIFNEWFVNFRFPGYEKTKMIESEIGEIPEGWDMGKLSDFGDVVCGKTPSKFQSEYFNGEFSFIKIPDMHNQMFILHTEDSLTQEGVDTQKSKLVPEGSICVSCIATVGLVSITTKNSQTNQQINTVIPKDKKFTEYLYFILTNMKNNLLAIGSGGSTTLNVNTSVFSNLEVLIPNFETVNAFHLIVSPFFKQTKQLLEENISLKSQRDLLLAKLI